MKKLFSFIQQYPKTTLVLAILWTILIFIGCSLPGRDLPKLGLFDHFDKVVHFIFFFIFFVLWRLVPSSNSMIILILAILYGFGLEFYQIHFVAGRSFDVWDGVADTFGALAGHYFTNLKSIKNNI
jgi:VanZ family protein